MTQILQTGIRILQSFAHSLVGQTKACLLNPRQKSQYLGGPSGRVKCRCGGEESSAAGVADASIENESVPKELTQPALVSGLEGTFWLAAEGTKVPGLLIKDSQPMKLQLDGMLTGNLRKILAGEIPEGLNVGPDWLVYPDEDPIEPDQLTVHGQVITGDKLEEVTLLATMLDRRSVIAPSLSGAEKRTVSTALLGGLTSGPEERFGAARMQFLNLDAWARIAPSHPFSNSVTFVELVDNAGKLTVRRSDAQNADGWYPRTQQTELVWQAQSEATALSLRDIWSQVVNPLRVAFTIALGSPSPPVGLAVCKTVSGGDWLYVQDSEIKSVDTKPTLPPSRLLLTRAEFGVDCLGTWLELFPKMSPVPSLVATAIETEAERAIELQVLDLAIATEGLHRRLFEARRGIPKKRASDIREYTIPLVEEKFPEAADAVRDALNGLGELPFRERLTDMIERARPVLPGLTGSSAELWIKRVKDVRNGFAHLLEGKDELSSQALENYILKNTLRWLLSVVVLLEVGVDGQVLSTRANANQQYSFLLMQAKRWMSEIYENATEAAEE